MLQNTIFEATLYKQNSKIKGCANKAKRYEMSTKISLSWFCVSHLLFRMALTLMFTISRDSVLETKNLFFSRRCQMQRVSWLGLGSCIPFTPQCIRFFQCFLWTSSLFQAFAYLFLIHILVQLKFFIQNTSWNFIKTVTRLTRETLGKIRKKKWGLHDKFVLESSSFVNRLENH